MDPIRGGCALLTAIYRKPRNEELFDRLDELAGYSQEAARLFRRFAFGDLPFPEAFSQIEALENRADETLRRINQALSAVFRPPPETKAGLSEIVKMIDNIGDLVQTAVRNIDSSWLMEDTEGFGEFAVILQKATVELGNAIHGRPGAFIVLLGLYWALANFRPRAVKRSPPGRPAPLCLPPSSPSAMARTTARTRWELSPLAGADRAARGLLGPVMGDPRLGILHGLGDPARGAGRLSRRWG